ncbi:KRI1-like family C-terminal-domain-containing protein [Massariosphaeria phaeospora]|uniref:KRI1-like family C-terminal-domain-containing protein n=1 Tax=Massariosphaeria phaeospora TaxID=100035 RepID=A0A7C8HYZ6_9PLEO|nr:KRI1-like family C-terminal-domain-containing protein [Massariosphaeria phaeospora]
MPRKSKKQENGVKRELDDANNPREASNGRPAKKVRLLDDSDDASDAEDGGVSLNVNEEYARRFEHNKRREEQHKLEAKYGKGKGLQDAGDSEDSEEGVEEDDDGELATEALDAEISATLQALRSKDPAIYKEDVAFYRPIDEADTSNIPSFKQDPSMTLKQYHTKNLLEGKLGGDDDEDMPLQTYAEEQEEVRQSLVRKIHTNDGDQDEDEDDDFMVAKPKPAGAQKERAKITEDDIVNADKDPDTFLRNFMATRAWVPTDDARFKPLESDDEDEEANADEYENAYNMYFEDTSAANEKLVTYARDAVASTTVRKGGLNGRRKAREAARAKREAERRQKEEELLRLRKLKVDEMEEKVQKIRRIGGLKGRDFKMEEWTDVLEADWSEEQWDAEMKKRFGDDYYDGGDGDDASDSDDGKRKKPKKPAFDDDIDIKDLVPDFDDEEDERPEFTLSDDEEAQLSAEDDAQDKNRATKSKQRKQERADAKSAARRDRRLIENLVDSSLEYESALASSKSKAPSRFRYRETSPTTFGLTSRDILLADDTQLNEFAGLKKLAAFRDPVKKKKDKKNLSKKARLRQWRLDTFGDVDGPKGGFETLVGDEGGVDGGGAAAAGGGDANGGDGGEKKKKKRSRKNKNQNGISALS